MDVAHVDLDQVGHARPYSHAERDATRRRHNGSLITREPRSLRDAN